MYELKEVQRQKGDDEFIRILNELRTGRLTEDSIATLAKRAEPLPMADGILPTRLFPRNEDVDHINMYALCATAVWKRP